VPVKDKDGRPCLAIKLKGAPAKRKRPVDPEEKAQKEAEKAARQAARKLTRKTGTSTPTAAPDTGVAAAEQNEKGT
jgi:DNA-binding IclR family transcriptional regulator